MLGLPLALIVGQLLESTLFQVSATDPLAYGGVPVALTLIALVASYVPAARATRNDPMRELRGE